MFKAFADWFGYGDEKEDIVDMRPIRGPGVHKHEFLGLRSERLSSVYAIHGELGRGAFGKVLAATHRTTGQEAVCKVIPKAPLKDQSMVRNEIEILRTLDHPNIVRMFEYFEDSQAFYILFERISGGDLQEAIKRCRAGLPEKQVARYIRQVLMAVNYCHSLPQPVVHRDLKPGNIMLVSKRSSSLIGSLGQGTPDVKIIDYGLGMMVSKGDLKKVCGTPVFMAPEVFDGHYGKEADIWAIGMMTYYLLTKELPFPGSLSRWEDFAFLVKSLRLDFPKRQGWSRRKLRSARDLIRGMMSQDRSKRPTAAQALRSEFLTSHAPRIGLGWRGYSKKLVNGLAGYASAPPVLRIMLLISACHMDQTQMGKMKRQFGAIDTDDDGFISLADLRSLLTSRCNTASASDPAELMVIADLDGDGVIGFTEFVAAWLYGRLGKDTDCVRHAFDLIDTDHDGYVSRDDVFTALNTPQLQDLGGSRALAADISDIFPTSYRLDCNQFIQHILNHEPVRLGLRFAMPRHKLLQERWACFLGGSGGARAEHQGPTTRGLAAAGSRSSAEYEANDSDMTGSETDNAGSGDCETESSSSEHQRRCRKLWC